MYYIVIMSIESFDRVLVVDDDPIIRKMLTRFLLARDFEVETAADGQEALDALRRGGIDVVLLDIEMPKLNGLEVLERFQIEGIDVGIIMISGADETAARKSLQMGASDFVVKPFDLDYLATSLMVKLQIG